LSPGQSSHIGDGGGGFHHSTQDSTPSSPSSDNPPDPPQNSNSGFMQPLMTMVSSMAMSRLGSSNTGEDQ
jgi:hypothetical protein